MFIVYDTFTANIYAHRSMYAAYQRHCSFVNEQEALASCSAKDSSQIEAHGLRSIEL